MCFFVTGAFRYRTPTRSDHFTTSTISLLGSPAAVFFGVERVTAPEHWRRLLLPAPSKHGHGLRSGGICEVLRFQISRWRSICRGGISSSIAYGEPVPSCVRRQSKSSVTLRQATTQAAYS